LSPLRVLILLGLFYVLFRLLIGSDRGERRATEQPESPDSSGLVASDILKEDPVCNTLIPTREAFTLKNNGKTLYFCSSNCRRKFITSQGDQS
jgi:YHS domain-containing protein